MQQELVSIKDYWEDYKQHLVDIGLWSTMPETVRTIFRETFYSGCVAMMSIQNDVILMKEVSREKAVEHTKNVAQEMRQFLATVRSAALHAKQEAKSGKKAH